MEINGIVVLAQITSMRGSVQKDVVVRDRESEEKVRNELREKLEKEGKLRKMPDEEFQSRYRERLRNYAPYANGRYTPQDPEDGKPGILVARNQWEHELELEYYVGRTRYTRSVAYCTDTNAVDKSTALYLTVNEDDPAQIISISDKGTPQQESGGAGAFFALLALAGVICYVVMEYLGITPA